MFVDWEQLYSLLGVKEFIYFISSPSIQAALFPVKLVFIFFGLCFLVGVIYFYTNSSYLKYKFLQDTTEFISKEAFGLGKINKSWRKIKKRTASGNESELKLAIIDADDFLHEALQDAEFVGNTFEELVTNGGKKTLNNSQELLDAHAVRNSIVYDPDYKIDPQEAKKILNVYEDTIKNISS